MGKYKSWSEKEFRAYLFLYAADSNFEYNADEKSFIESKFDSKTLETIKYETDGLNDFQRSKIITDYIKLKNIKHPYGDGGASLKIFNILKKIDLKNISQKRFFDL